MSTKSDIQARLAELEGMMAAHNWSYQASNDGHQWQRSHAMEQSIVRESYELRVAGFDAEVDLLWQRYDKR